jgi:hypothetical protein
MWAAELRRKTEAKIALARSEMEDTHTALSSSAVQDMSDIRAELETKLGTLHDKQNEVHERKEFLAGLREQAKASLKVRTLLEQAKQFDADAAELRGKAQHLTDAISALDEYRRGLADDLPISGLAVGKTITVEGVPFDQLNTAQQIKIAVKIACLRAHDQRLPIVWVDGAERLDKESFAHLIESLTAEDVQAFIGRVTDKPLEITTDKGE